MIDSSLPEGEWDDYPLGQTSGSERRRFETRLATDPGLRTLARELEEGMLALALSAPQRPAPPQAWHNIQAAINPRQNWNLWLFLAGLKWAARGRIAAACLTTVCILHFVSPQPATTRVAEAAPAKPVAAKPLARIEAPTDSIETPVASTAESQTEAAPQKTDRHTIQSAVWSKAPAARPRITPLPAYTTTPTLPGCIKQPAFTHQGNWFARAGERHGNLKLASAAANNVGRNNHRGGCGSFTDPNNNNPPPTSGGFSPFDAENNTGTNTVSSGPDFIQGADVNDIPMRQSGHYVVALTGSGLAFPVAEPLTESLTVWFIDVNGNASVLETINPWNESAVTILPPIDVVDGEQYWITPSDSYDVVGEFPPAQ